MKKTQEQKNSKLKEKTQGLDKIDADKEWNQENSAIKIPTFSETHGDGLKNYPFLS